MYLGPPNWLIYNAGINFASTEFRSKALLIEITYKQVFIEAY